MTCLDYLLLLLHFRLERVQKNPTSKTHHPILDTLLFAPWQQDFQMNSNKVMINTTMCIKTNEGPFLFIWKLLLCVPTYEVLSPIHVCVHMFMCHREMLGVFKCFPPYFLRQVLSVNTKLASSAGLDGQKAPEIRDCRHAAAPGSSSSSLFNVGAGIKLRFSCSHSKHFINHDISPALQLIHYFKVFQEF